MMTRIITLALLTAALGVGAAQAQTAPQAPPPIGAQPATPSDPSQPPAIAAPTAAPVATQTKAPVATQATAPVDAAGQAEPATDPQTAEGEDGTAPGASGWTGGTGGSMIGTNPQGAVSESVTWQPPTARGLDLRGVPDPAS